MRTTDKTAGAQLPPTTSPTRCTFPYLGSHCTDCRAALLRITTGAPWHEIPELVQLVFDHNATSDDLEKMRERLFGVALTKP